MTTTIIIDDNSIQAKQLIEYIKTLPFAKVVDNKKNTLEEAAAEYGSVSVDEFIGELRNQVDKHFIDNEESTSI